MQKKKLMETKKKTQTAFTAKQLHILNKTFTGKMFLEKPCISHISLAYCSFVLVAMETIMQKNGSAL